jgi:Amt family ammonium transporter
MGAVVNWVRLALSVGLLLTIAPEVFAQDSGASGKGPTFNALDTFWIVFAAVLVFFMQAGFGLVEAGLVRAKNAGNILMKNLMDFSIAAITFLAVGYAVMWGAGNAFMGTEGWFLIGLETPVEGVPLYAFWLFQAAFAGAAATIVAGGVAERMKFVSYLLYTIAISALIYPIVGHWVWGGGWLSEMGFYDFAGSTVVHGVGGVAALVGSMMLGPRIGKFDKDGNPKVISGHSMPLAALGVFILWLGWFGFNAGSTLSLSDPAVVALIVINTTLAAAAGAILAMIVAWIKFGKPDVSISFNGVLAGLVGITAPCAAVTPLTAILIGAIAGILVVLGILMFDKLRIDDPVGAISVHGLCGIWGTLAVGLFGLKSLGANSDGLFVGGGFDALWIQIVGTFACLAFTAVTMWIVFKLIAVTVGLRVSREAELRGLDVREHAMESYAGFQIFVTE